MTEQVAFPAAPEKAVRSASLKEITLHLLQNRSVKHTYDLIAECSGCNVDWLKRFSRGVTQIDDADNVQRTYEFFCGPLNIVDPR